MNINQLLNSNSLRVISKLTSGRSRIWCDAGCLLLHKIWLPAQTLLIHANLFAFYVFSPNLKFKLLIKLLKWPTHASMIGFMINFPIMSKTISSYNRVSFMILVLCSWFFSVILSFCLTVSCVAFHFLPLHHFPSCFLAAHTCLGISILSLSIRPVSSALPSPRSLFLAVFFFSLVPSPGFLRLTPPIPLPLVSCACI